MARAVIVLILFVAATVLVLSDIHPSASKTPPASAAVTTTTTKSSTTTKPSHSSKTAHPPPTTTTTVPPSKVPVLVANGSGITGAAAALSARIQASGWDMLPPTNATSDVTTSSIYYKPGFQPSAASIASSLSLPAKAVAPYTSAVPVASVGTAEVVVVAGPDLSSNSSTATTAA